MAPKVAITEYAMKLMAFTFERPKLNFFATEAGRKFARISSPYGYKSGREKKVIKGQI